MSGWTIGKKLIAANMAMVVAFIVCGVYFKFAFEKIRIGGVFYNQIISNKDLTADILPPPAYIIESYLYALEIATAEPSQQKREQLLTRLAEMDKGPGYYQERMAHWEKVLVGQDIRSVFLGDAANSAQRFFSSALGPFAEAVRADQMDAARAIFFEKLRPAYKQHRDAIDRVVELAAKEFAALEAESVATIRFHEGMQVTLSILMGALALGVGVLVSRNVSRPMSAGVGILEEVARGNMKPDIPQAFMNRSDEIGNMGASLQSLVSQLGAMIRDMVSGVEQLNNSSAELGSVSGQLLDAAHETSARSATVNGTAEELSSNMRSVADTMEQSAANVSMISEFLQEMIGSINEISQRADETRTISLNAVEQAKHASGKMASLGDSASNIGRVTETITEISEQTNLLALNATIEAARAGEAGKGFAVVANEIKELARQTAAATVDIKNQISEMQTTTGSTVKDIASVVDVIEKINNMIAEIATSVDEQSAASNEIALNIAEASTGMDEVNQSVASSTDAVGDVSMEIATISHHAAQVEESSRQVKLSATALTGLAGQLKVLVERFQV